MTDDILSWQMQIALPDDRLHDILIAKSLNILH
jgi:hypothetical protein